MFEQIAQSALEWAVTNPLLAVYTVAPLTAIGSIYVVCSAVIAATPTKKDDEALALIESKIGWLLKIAQRFSYFQPKK